MFDPTMLIDAYKLDHRRQYPAKTERVYSNWTPRASRVEGVDKVVFFGLQYFLVEYLEGQFGEFFASDVEDVVEKYARRVEGVLGPNEIGTDHIRALHELGYLPLRFKALPEGTSVPIRVPMLTVENTHEDFAWLVNYIETLMSNVLWLPCTSATTAKRMRDLLVARAVESGGPVEFVDWQGHDFSFRGMAGVESAVMSGMGHLTCFTGTDTIPAIEGVERYYGGEGFIGGSVAATEHSVMCAGGMETERDTFERIIDLYPTGIVSIVSDTWDFWNVVTVTVPSLKDKILARDGKVVIRPDSGDPVKIVVGDPDAPVDSPEYKGVVQLLWEHFGGTVNEKGFKELDPHIGVIYGDSINYERADAITAGLMAKGFASTNVVFGMGSYGYQYVTRDTFGFAMKATWVQIDGVGQAIFKDPKTDDGTKKSLKGRLMVLENRHGDITVFDDTAEWEVTLIGDKDLLATVWEDGKFVRRTTFDEVRNRIAND